MAQMDAITNYLTGLRKQPAPLDQAMLTRSLKGTNVTAKADTIPNAGLFGTPGTLPGNPGPPEPPILPGSELPNNAFANNSSGPTVDVSGYSGGLPSPYWNQPPGQAGGGPSGYSTAPNVGGAPFINFGPGGQAMGGVNGPQGTVYGYDPNTGQAVFNATGSPAPGFFDSTTGKIVENVASAGANFFVPGLGFVAKAIFDAYRRNQNRNNTGTDLSNTKLNPDNTNQPTNQPTNQQPSGPAWFQPGYRPSQGIQGAIARGDYQTAYGASPSSITANRIMSSQSYGGVPNQYGPDSANTFYGHQAGMHRSVDSEGIVGLSPVTNPTPVGPAFQGVQHSNPPSAAQGASAYNDWLMRQPEYLAWANGRPKQAPPFAPNISGPFVGPLQGGG